MDINKLCIHCMNEIDVNKGSFCPHCGHNIGQQPELTHQLRPMTILRGKFLVGDVLGEGGFGITYIGLDLNLELKVAIKEFYPNGYATREPASTSMLTIYSGQNAQAVYKWRDNFMKEARSLAKCARLPGVVGVRDFFEENNTAYLVMEYVEGDTLKNYAKKKGGRIAASELLIAIEPVFTALGEVHRQGLIHRDISPDNIMLLSGGKMKLLDFGAAREYVADEKSLSVMLKPGYAPEEQYRTKGKQGPWSDIYALAGTIYKCLTGLTPPEAMERMRRDELQRPNSVGAGLTAGQEQALVKALAVRAEDRYQTMEEFRRDLYADREVLQSTSHVKTAQSGQQAAESAYTAYSAQTGHAMEMTQIGNQVRAGDIQTKQNTSKMGLILGGLVILTVVIIMGVMKSSGNRETVVSQPEVAERESARNDSVPEPDSEPEKQEEIVAAETEDSLVRTTLSPDEIEAEVLRIREVWNADRDAVSNGWFDRIELEPGVAAYYDAGNLKMVEANMDYYGSLIMQIEENELTFAYYENGDLQDRLYFKNDLLFRWIHTEIGQDPVIHDNEWENNAFVTWQQDAQSLWQELLNYSNMDNIVTEDTAIHRYELIVADTSWSGAYWDCIERGGYLVRVNSPEEFAVITDQIRMENKKNVIFWLGAARFADSSQYFWVDSQWNTVGECINTPNYRDYWLENEPSMTGINEAGEEEIETCLSMIYRSSADRFYWNDAPDDILSTASFYQGRIGYICEYEN